MKKWIVTLLITALVPPAFMFVKGNMDVMGWSSDARLFLVLCTATAFTVSFTCPFWER